jgi:hypothetical protein
MYSLFPDRSLVKNIGFDGSGTHCDITEIYEASVSTDQISLQKIEIIESITARKALKTFFEKQNRLRKKQIINNAFSVKFWAKKIKF